MKITLKKGIQNKGKTIKELDLDLDALTGADLIEVEQGILRDGTLNVLGEFSKVYQIRLAAKAAHVPHEALNALGAVDFLAVTGAVQRFLTGSASAETDEPQEAGATDPA